MGPEPRPGEDAQIGSSGRKLFDRIIAVVRYVQIACAIEDHAVGGANPVTGKYPQIDPVGGKLLDFIAEVV